MESMFGLNYDWCIGSDVMGVILLWVMYVCCLVMIGDDFCWLYL